MQLSVNAFVSLDGVMQGPGGPQEDPTGGFTGGGWLVPFDVAGWGPVVDAWFSGTSAVLLGRTTFAMMREYWPLVTDPDNRVAAVLNGGRKYVVSSTLSDEDAAWGDTTVLRGDPVTEVRDLTARGDGDLQVHGSWQLVRALHDAGLVDVYRLLVFPVVVGGGGKRLFDEGAMPTGFDHPTATALPGGVVSVELRGARQGGREARSYAVQDGKESIA
ncbi:dihydrofolate reductase family protein [Cellulomonas fengjieae]|uniref:dihydrofolate reductase family protein n=1 Tax=Cellulomonas fengjieae TaxID=2819978 RepID=UPI001AAF32F7|nr:dihydrofolate reductase family protein [Cellulomonas fengjieae]MBO3102556.1 dihydrofolate reductase family protein [Cellulomonas fengjieae]